MRTEAQTSMHLLMAATLSILSVILSMITLSMIWELWMIPLIIISCLAVWWLHIGRIGSELLYENLCTGLLLIEFFFFGVHRTTLFDIPLVACVVLLLLSLLNRKRLLYMAAVLYVSLLLYHALVLNDINSSLDQQSVLRLLMGVAAVAGAVTVGRYRINRRRKEYENYSSIQEQLATAVQQNADFLSNVSHELRTPVNMVIGISEVTLGKDISSEVRENIQSIKLAGKRLSSQINNILDYTEIVENTLSAAKEAYKITSVLNDVITTTALQNSSHHLELVFDMDPRIPATLIGDAEKISHVLNILLENSLKFTEEGGIAVRLGFRRESYGINLIIDIKDTGIGMKSEQLDRMIDAFYQADSGSRRYVGGLGLGIPIARGLLHAMGGFVHFESKAQQGLQVHITIPQGVEDDAPCIVVPEPSKLCIACFFKPERYSRDEVRKYYDDMILHIVEGLGIEGYQAHNFEGLLKLQRDHKLSHIFITQTEYMANPPYYEEMAMTIPVAVIAEKSFTLDADSRLKILRKPFFVLSIVNLLGITEEDSCFEEARAAGHRPFTCTNVRVLAVDDEEMNLLVAKGVLGSYGIQVDTCLSGKAAIERCAETSYDIIFLDHMMPGFDGVETLRRIREMNNGMYKDLPVIALTANTISGAREMFRSEGFTEFIPKPIERSVLERVLRRVLPEHCMIYDTDTSHAESLSENSENGDAISQIKEKVSEVKDVHPYTDTVPEDSNTEAEKPSRSYGSLVRAGINVGLGLDYCSGEEEFYLEMLQMFHDQEAEKRAELIALYEAANWKDYAIKVHALKSTSLTIGAEELSKQAKALEQAGKEENVAYIQENHPLLLQMYRKICECISGL
ncbi:MAG: response regulator [Lachnospiraceae bacterium]|nr:response regulator [uncultured Acetatifactor sp.]MCI8287135.1 response regulator [Lachnospiraceae bacterium]